MSMRTSYILMVTDVYTRCHATITHEHSPYTNLSMRTYRPMVVDRCVHTVPYTMRPMHRCYGRMFMLGAGTFAPGAGTFGPVPVLLSHWPDPHVGTRLVVKRRARTCMYSCAQASSDVLNCRLASICRVLHWCRYFCTGAGAFAVWARSARRSASSTRDSRSYLHAFVCSDTLGLA